MENYSKQQEKVLGKQTFEKKVDKGSKQRRIIQSIIIKQPVEKETQKTSSVDQDIPEKVSLPSFGSHLKKSMRKRLSSCFELR